MKTHWFIGQDGYKFNMNIDVCVFIPKKVKLDRVIVKRKPVARQTSKQVA